METRIVVQHQVTGLFLEGRKQWTPDSRKAFCFPQTVMARLFCARNNLADAQVLIRSGEGEYDVPLGGGNWPLAVRPGGAVEIADAMRKRWNF